MVIMALQTMNKCELAGHSHWILIQHCCKISHIFTVLIHSKRQRTEKYTTSSQKSQLYCTFIVNYSVVRATFIMKGLFPGQKRWCKIQNHQCKHVDRPFTLVNVPLCHFESQSDTLQPTNMSYGNEDCRSLSCTVHTTVTQGRSCMKTDNSLTHK